MTLNRTPQATKLVCILHFKEGNILCSVNPAFNSKHLFLPKIYEISCNQHPVEDNCQRAEVMAFFKNHFYFFSAVLGLHSWTSFSLVAGSGGYFPLKCMGFSLQWLLLLQSTGSRARGLQQLQLPGSTAQAQCLRHVGLVAS